MYALAASPDSSLVWESGNPLHYGLPSGSLLLNPALFSTGRLPTCCFWLLLQLPGAAPSFPARCARSAQEPIARVLSVSSGSTFARKSVFAMLEGLTLGRVFSLGPENRQNCCSLGGTVPLVSLFVILHSDSQWGNFCFGGYREVAGDKNTPCLLPRGDYDQLTSLFILLDSQGVDNRHIRRGSRSWAKPLQTAATAKPFILLWKAVSLWSIHSLKGLVGTSLWVNFKVWHHSYGQTPYHKAPSIWRILGLEFNSKPGTLGACTSLCPLWVGGNRKRVLSWNRS